MFPLKFTGVKWIFYKGLFPVQLKIETGFLYYPILPFHSTILAFTSYFFEQEFDNII